MKAIVVGLGSMGKRRVRLLKKINPNIQILGIDTNHERAEQCEKEYGIKTDSDLDRALNNFGADFVVISTSPLSHAKIIEKCLQEDHHVFVELNLVDDLYRENMQLAEKMQKVLFMSSTFLYRDEIQYIMTETAGMTAHLSYSYHVGQYLPDWHPWESIFDFFVSDARTNGCRELLAIELPWLTKTFGKIKRWEILKSKNSSLKLSYMDNYLLLLEHESGSKGMLTVDVVSRKAVRNLEIFGENIYLSWDGSPFGLRKYDFEKKQDQEISLYESVDQRSGYSAFIVENAYQKELENFIECIASKAQPRYSFEEDLEILHIIDQMENNESE